jgi:uncharacterized protein
MSNAFVPFLYELRAQGVKAGATELVQLARALKLGLHRSSLDGFYGVARALLVHREQDLDAFDRAFAKHFRGAVDDGTLALGAVLDWLRDPKQLENLTEEQLAALREFDVDELRAMLEERLREQKERHDGGNRFVGTGGTSPFGTGGMHPTGVRVGGGGSRSAIGVADARMFAPYRSDVTLDVRQIEVALRKLRSYLRDGVPDELDLEGTIDATARNAGELEVKVRPPRKPNMRVLLLMDVGGSMDPYAHAVSQLFSAAKRASNLREVRSYYFHNCIYGHVYPTEFLAESVRVSDLLHQLDNRWRLVVVGDASMHPAELLGSSPWSGRYDRADGNTTGLGWLMRLAEHFHRSVWLNPDQPRYWGQGTAEVIGGVFSMFHLSLEGLGEAVRHLSRKA